MEESTTECRGLREELLCLDQRHFLHPTTVIKEQQENGAAALINEGKGIYLKDINGSVYIDGLSSLWNVNVGHFFNRRNKNRTMKE
ncbi:MAG: hypothetical protein KGZ79_04500 [Dethiobacter sp.]|jgi:adenosylmethionine-8-amino-7-oxononanoate aminotransferase|nr:hypothetical protein [Dethiobacter sp.]